MANVYTTNPIYLDTWSDDKVISSGAMYIKGIKLYSDDTATRVLLEDKDGVTIVILGPGKTEYQYLDSHFTNGVVLDVSDCDHADSHAKVLIYV